MNRILFAFPVLVVSLALASPAFAIEPVDADGHVFGLLNDGTYQGSCALESQSIWIPDARFSSTRKIKGGVIDVHSSATVFGIEVASASARLQVVALDGQNFDMMDLDSLGSDGKPLKAGSGTCELLSCSFDVTILGGRLTLHETWVPSDKSFELVHGSQVYDGKPATYQGRFQLN